MSFNLDLSQKIVLITGGTRGIGKAIAKVFIDAGAKVILTGTKIDEIKKLKNKNKNMLIEWIFADFSTEIGMKLFLKELSNYPKIDICINNAGINIIKPIENICNEELQKMYLVNLTAPILITKNILPKMILNKFGRIINIGSIWSKITKKNRSLYSTTKTGLLGFTRAMSVEHGKKNILFNMISPGFTKTDLTKNSLSKKQIKILEKQIPLKRLASPNEIAMLVLFLCSDLNTYITGQNVIIDGGFTIV